MARLNLAIFSPLLGKEPVGEAGGEEDHHAEGYEDGDDAPCDVDYFFGAFVEEETHGIKVLATSH